MTSVHATLVTAFIAVAALTSGGCTNTPDCWCEGTVSGGYVDMACNDTVCFGGTTGYRCTGPDIAEPDPAACEGPPPDVTVNVTMRQAAIGVGKSDGCQWDGISCDPIGDETIGTLVMLVTRAAEATAGIPRTEASDEVLTFLLSSAQAHYSKPDVGGWTHVDVGRGWEVPLETPQTEDSYVAVLNIQYTGASLDNTTYALDLEDRDFGSAPDPVGSVTITPRQVREIFDTGGTGWVVFPPDGVNQILMVQLDVTVAR